MPRYQQFRSPGSLRPFFAAIGLFLLFGFGIMLLMARSGYIFIFRRVVNDSMEGNSLYRIQEHISNTLSASDLLDLTDALPLDEDSRYFSREPSAGPYAPSDMEASEVFRYRLYGLPDRFTEEARTFWVFEFRNGKEVSAALHCLSPSGGRLYARTGPASRQTITLPADADRLVWRYGNCLVYYAGGSGEIEALFTSLAGSPVADGSLSDPPEKRLWLPERLWFLFHWENLPFYAICFSFGLTGAACLILALRPPRKDPSAAARQLVARLAQRGVPLSPYGRMAQGPFGRFPHEVSFSAYLPAYSAGDIRKGEREADRQGKTAFPENLLAVSFFPSARKAKQAAALVAPSGDRLKAGNVRLPYAPARRLYRKDGMIVYYAGPDRKLAGALEAICGKPFAGAGVRSRREA